MREITYGLARLDFVLLGSSESEIAPHSLEEKEGILVLGTLSCKIGPE